MSTTSFRRENFVEVWLDDDDRVVIHAPTRFLAYQLLDTAMTAMDEEASGNPRKAIFRFTEEGEA